MSYRDKKWYTPISYNDPREEPARPAFMNPPLPTDNQLPESEIDHDHNAFDVPRSTGGRDAVKPVGGSRDNTPLHYRRARPDKNELDLDDDEYIDLAASAEGEE